MGLYMPMPLKKMAFSYSQIPAVPLFLNQNHTCWANVPLNFLKSRKIRSATEIGFLRVWKLEIAQNTGSWC